MMRKYFFLLIFCLSFFSSYPMQFSNVLVKGQSTKTINLYGDLASGPGLNSVVKPTIIAELEGDSVSLLFQKNVGVLKITITNEQGVVILSDIDTTDTYSFNLSLSGSPKGLYTITLSNEQGKMWGIFELE